MSPSVSAAVTVLQWQFSSAARRYQLTHHYRARHAFDVRIRFQWPTPEPLSAVLLATGLGIAALGWFRRKGTWRGHVNDSAAWLVNLSSSSLPLEVRVAIDASHHDLHAPPPQLS